ncbi:ArsR/SmtB family transcription factor [Terribacillus saccharophilus]|uniref:ArsR/SmtB family transcription factor n=1 Tax=Terribacillus saccharophilus TaxID=361277 RepID=UPI0038090DE1
MLTQSTLSTAQTLNCMKLLSDSTRLIILKLVQKKQYCVCQFVEMFQTSQPSISQHLRKLKNAGMVKEERKEQWRFYSLNEDYEGIDLVNSVLNQIDENDEVLQAIKKREFPVSCN